MDNNIQYERDKNENETNSILSITSESSNSTTSSTIVTPPISPSSSKSDLSVHGTNYTIKIALKQYVPSSAMKILCGLHP